MTNNNNMGMSSTEPRNIIERYTIIWLDSDTQHANENTKDLFDNIRNRIDSIQIFIDFDEYVRFLDSIKTEQIVMMIIVDSFNQERIRLIDLIEETNQINSVYVLSNDLSQDKHWTNDCKKRKGIFTQIDHLANAFERTICPLENDFSATTIISSVDNDLDELDQSYIYSKLLTGIIHEIEYDDQAKKDAFLFCREYYADNQTKLDEIEQFEENYEHNSLIWWYTKETPINVLLRDALITQNFDLMLKMGFFIQGLHHEIQHIHSETDQTTSLNVYRGQGMSTNDFDNFLQRKGGFYAFHNFISTSTDEKIALHFAESAKVDPQATGILFQMEINPMIFPTAFAAIDDIGYYLHRESEVLFSTHAIFQIGDISRIDDRLWKVNLTLPCDIDQQIDLLTDPIQKEIQGINVWHSLALFFHKIGRYNKAIEFFNKIIEDIDDDDQDYFLSVLSSTQNNLALMHDLMGNYPSAITWYEQALEIQKRSLPPDHPSLAIVYANIGMAYRSMGNYRQALLYCEKSLEIRLKCSPENHISLTTIYSNIGLIHESKGDFVTARSYYEKTYEIQKCSLATDDLSLTLSYNNFGGISSSTGEYPMALSFYEKTLEIQSKFLLPDHPSLAITFGNIGHVYQLMENYSMSLVFYEETIKIQEKTASSNRLSLATTYNNIGLVYRLMGNSRKALSYYKKTVEIEENAFSTEPHPSLGYTYNNLGALYQSLGEYDKALAYYKKTYDIWRSTLSPNHPSLATIQNNVGSVHDSQGNHTKAISCYEIAIDILQKCPSANLLDLASTYNNVGEMYRSMKDYPKALSYYQKTLEIEEKHLSPRHPSLGSTLSNMAVAFDANNQYEEAIQHAQRAFDILSGALGSNDSQTKSTWQFLHELRQKLPSNST